MKFFHPNGFIRADDMVDCVRDAIDVLLEERDVGRPGNFAAFKHILELLDANGTPLAYLRPRRTTACKP